MYTNIISLCLCSSFVVATHYETSAQHLIFHLSSHLSPHSPSLPFSLPLPCISNAHRLLCSHRCPPTSASCMRVFVFVRMSLSIVLVSIHLLMIYQLLIHTW